MPSPRAFRRLVALVTLCGWALLHVQTLAHACPVEAPAPASPVSAAAPGSAGDAAAPCAEHCATRHSALPLLGPVIPAAPPAAVPLRVEPFVAPLGALLAARHFDDRRAERAAPVPLLIQLQVFRE